MARFGKALTKGLDILDLFVLEQRSLSYGEIKDRLDIPPASFARFLKILTERGYVRRLENNKYCLGWSSANIGFSAVQSMPLREICRPHLEHIATEVEESTELVAYEKGFFFFLDRVQCSRSVVLQATPGSRYPDSPDTALGWIAAAYNLSEPSRGFRQKECERIRKEKYYQRLQNDNEVYRGASPVFTHASCVGAICIAAPAFRVTAGKKRQFKKLLQTHAQRISQTLSGESANGNS